MIDPEPEVVNETQKPLIKLLARHGIESIPLKLRNCLTLSGGFHCVSLDVRRKGILEDYS
jgi:glycine amidinotransferase